MNNKGIYHNGVSAQPFDCDLVLHDGSLYLYLQDPDKPLLIWTYGNISSCHMNGSSLIVKYGQFPHQTLECSGEMARSIYNAWSGNSLVRKAEGFVFKKKFLSALILSAAFLALCIVGYFFILPWAGEKAVALVPVSAELQMGQQLSEAFMHGEKVNDSATYYANEFIAKLILDSPYPLHVQVVESKEVNAFALPGGNIVIYTGILSKMGSYEELAALLGHEVTHVIHRHSLKSIFRTMASSLLIASLFGDMTGISSAVLSQVDQFKQLDYSRELETEADVNSLKILAENKIDPKGMLDLLKLLKKESMEMPGMMKYLSSHPETDKRIETVRQKTASMPLLLAHRDLETIFARLKTVAD